MHVRRARSSIASLDRRLCRAISSIALLDHRSRRSSARCDRRTSGAIWALSSLSLSLIWALPSLSLSLFFRKLFEVKMRGENDFRVKGKNIGQPEVIFRKMIFFVTAKHAEKGENDFLKSFSCKKTIFFIPTHAYAISLSHSHTQRQPTTAQLLPSLPPASPRPAQPSLPFAQACVVIFSVVGSIGAVEFRTTMY